MLPVLVALAVLSVLLAGGMLYVCLSTRARLRLRDEELAAIRKELQERSTALAAAESEVERLKRIPKAELLPMLKLAHEQRSPLAAIQNALDMLLQGYATTDPQLQNEMLNLARDRAATMLERVNDFLRLGAVRHAEIERKVQPVQLVEVLERMVPEKRLQARSRAVDFRVDVPVSLPVVTATYEDMEHLLSNLINNAIKYTNPGGRVTVTLKEEGGNVAGLVEDTGIGISPEDLPKLFTEFYRAESARGMHANGTGLGLAIVKRVADLYGGRLDVESEPGKGSKFSFAFPPGMAAREEEKARTFHDLQEEVLHRGICSQCGACVSFCTASRWNALEVGVDGWPRYADEGKCLKCGICYLICPLTADLDAEVRRRCGWKPPIGMVQAVAAARATDSALVRMSSMADGGVVAALLLYMLENYLIQGAILPWETSAFSREPWVVTSKEDLTSGDGAQYADRRATDVPMYPSALVRVVRQEQESERYTTYTPLLSEVKGLEGRRLSQVALVGTPCQVRTIRKMQCLGIAPAHAIGYTIGSFCMESLSFDAQGRRRLEDRLHVDLADVQRLVLKEDVGLVLGDGTIAHLPFEVTDEMAGPACRVCTEFASDYADIAIGGLGSPEGYATTLIRTDKGSRIYNGALRQGYIEEREFRDAAELRSERARALATVIAFAQRKRERGEARLKELGVEGDGGR